MNVNLLPLCVSFSHIKTNLIKMKYILCSAKIQTTIKELFESEHEIRRRMKKYKPKRLKKNQKKSFYCIQRSFFTRAAQNMIIFIHFDSCLFHHRIYYEFTMACPPLISLSMDRALRPVIAKVKVWFLISEPEWFQVPI